MSTPLYSALARAPHGEPAANAHERDPDESGIIPTPYRAISRPLADPLGSLVDNGFVSEQKLADLLFRHGVRRVGPGIVASGGRRFALHEAVRVLGRADGQSDPYGLSGAVERLSDLTRAGAQLHGASMDLGSVSYRVERGVIAEPRDPMAVAAYDPFELLSV